MKKFKVIDPKGFHFGGNLIEKGGTFSTVEKSAVATTAVHFGQIKAVEEKADDSEAASKAKAEKEKADADLKAKEEAEVKAKAEAASKK